jgi:hypothetical protein
MDALRNVSSQSLILQKPGGGNVHLLPNRAVTLSAEELQSPQVQAMVKNGLAAIEKLGAPPPPAQANERRRSADSSSPKAPK